MTDAPPFTPVYEENFFRVISYSISRTWYLVPNLKKVENFPYSHVGVK